MAQAFFERLGPDDVAMNEVGTDISGRKPKPQMIEMQLHADWAVTMGCGDACPYVPTTVEAVLAQYDDARIRSHILTRAHPQTRKCLRPTSATRWR
jgi:hypothetical protein